MSMKLEVEGTNIEAWQKIYDHWDLERLGYSETCRSDPCVCQGVGCTDNKVTSLQLIGKELTNIPKEIGELKALTYLDLSSNQLTFIPKEIGGLTALTELHLRSNQLTAIPKELGKLKTLVYLSLFDNQLTVIPKDLWELTALTELMEKHLEIQNRH